ncbi:hypothetical protein DFJ58DRAFT_738822 [Suillus subalutaceus]|uniref:uncharacterized protein n=1 Tax=Suillus subalutaceus TaxID=48586 RepID=UPI001B86D4E3|nr:uncharacterized protein DFJ58DRAFT_738822 [Suillus subalutaceus]KAG1823258.1 hypothetical protein DFJ58DRAFT_738822 [Suillus subalutaceus]
MSLTAAGAIGEHTVPSEKVDADSDSEEGVLSNEREIATHVISVDDDPSLEPVDIPCILYWSWPLNLWWSTRGNLLFQASTVYVSLMFLAVVSYILGIFMEPLFLVADSCAI